MINVIRVARLVCCCLCVHAGVWAQNKISLNIAKAGTLSEQIASSKKYQIDELIVSGTLNGSDIRFIRDMAGCDATGKETKGILRKLICPELTLSREGIIIMKRAVLNTIH